MNTSKEGVTVIKDGSNPVAIIYFQDRHRVVYKLEEVNEEELADLINQKNHGYGQ